jgi:hypothetical protein
MLLDRIEQIRLGVEDGLSLSDLEANVIDHATDLGEDERAALWLFAWSYDASRPIRQQRTYEAVLAR